MPDATELVVGAGGKVYVGNAGSAPTTEVSAMPGDFVDVGYVSQDGVTFHDEITRNEVMAWQSRYPIRRIMDARVTTAAFALQQWNGDTVKLAFQGGSIVGGNGVAEQQAIALVGFAGTDSFKLTYGGNESALITRGTNYTAAGIKAAIEGITAFGATVTVSDVSDEGFLVTWNSVGVRTNFTVTTTTGVTGDSVTLVAGAAAAGSSFRYNPPLDSDDEDFRSMVIEWLDGTKHYRLVIPRGMATAAVETQLTLSNVSDLPLTFTATPDSGDVNPWYLLTDDPAFA